MDSPAAPPAPVSDSAAAHSAAETPLAPQPWWYYAIFAASGFAALIYESLWARYLKIFLGHAAYAQALVLIVFLFGIAAGSFLVARWSQKIARPLLAYAAVEALLAVVAVYFHDIFTAAQEWGLSDVLPQIASDRGAEIFKWALGASLILPQTVLLGATFPLLAAGIVRYWPQSPGKTISALYYANSGGAALGVLVGGFVLVPAIGLIGAGLIGGALNAAIAALVWGLARRFGEIQIRGGQESKPQESALPESKLRESESQESELQESKTRQAEKYADGAVLSGGGFLSLTEGKLLMLTAAVTGMSSFIYEIVWLRMIALLLGASVYSFEIMLAVFIGGLALGSFLIRRRIDRIAEPLVLLARVQLAMGALALLSLLLYPAAFKVYAYLWGVLPRGGGIHIYQWLCGGALVAALVLPAAVCAGMTLPLITNRLMQRRGESSLGAVYGANTLGAIAGVGLAVHWLLPETGVQNAMIVGALFDLLLGCALLAFARGRFSGAGLAGGFTAAAVAAALIFGGVPLRYAASGIYRHGALNSGEIVFYRDGKTASVSVLKSPDKEGEGYHLSIRTNGKTDAALYYGDGYSADEMTMVISGVLPLLARPDARRAANIGFGSGLTSMALLQSPHLMELDNIEIEPVMAAGAKRLGDKVAPVFSDPRNRFIFDDAKTVFARAKEPYDIIISEPSNPWISGIGGLFTSEFYRQVKTALAPGGVFIQWMPLYESSPHIFASVAAALGGEFGDFRMYLSGGNIIIAAVAEDAAPPLRDDIFAAPAARDFFAAYDFRAAENVGALFAGEKRHLAPYFASFFVRPNSDYFPFVEHEAPRAFFRKTEYSWGAAQMLPVPFMEMSESRPPSPRFAAMRHSPVARRGAAIQKAIAGLEDENGALRRRIAALQQSACAVETEKEEAYMLSVSDFSAALLPVASADAMKKVWDILAENSCMAERLLPEAPSAAAQYTRFWRAVSLRDGAETARLADLLLDDIAPDAPSGQIVLLAAMAGHYQQGNYFRVVSLLHRIPPVNPAVHHAARFLGALAAQKI
ncbi:MAG: hypothetical protein ACR2P5_01755 [Gammaproteobacteria bacterium]